MSSHENKETEELSSKMKKVAISKKQCAVCGEEARHMCSLCKEVSYCGKQHQKIHWKQQHKKTCIGNKKQPYYVPPSSAAPKSNEMTSNNKVATATALSESKNSDDSDEEDEDTPASREKRLKYLNEEIEELEEMLDEVDLEKIFEGKHQTTNEDDVVNFGLKAQLERFKEEREIILEKQRVDCIVESFKSQGVPFHDPEDTDESIECPLCNKVFFHTFNMSPPVCCGKKFCDKCGESWFGSCAFCRTPFPKDEDEYFERLIQRAEEGKAWAQCLAHRLCKSRGQDERSLHWLRMAADQGDLEGLQILGLHYLDRELCGWTDWIVEKSNDEAKRLLKAAAMGGDGESQYAYSRILAEGDKQYDEAIRWYTFAAVQGRPIVDARGKMGDIYKYGKFDVDRSLERAIYWYRLSLEQENDIENKNDREFSTECELAECLIVLAQQRFGELFDVLGYSVMPEVFYHFHNAAKKGSEKAVQMVKYYTDYHDCCVVCKKKKDQCPNEKLQRCSRCHFQAYCGRECQIKAWQMGHKDDCYPPLVKSKK